MFPRRRARLRMRRAPGSTIGPATCEARPGREDRCSRRGGCPRPGRPQGPPPSTPLNVVRPRVGSPGVRLRARRPPRGRLAAARRPAGGSDPPVRRVPMRKSWLTVAQDLPKGKSRTPRHVRTRLRHARLRRALNKNEGGSSWDSRIFHGAGGREALRTLNVVSPVN